MDKKTGKMKYVEMLVNRREKSNVCSLLQLIVEFSLIFCVYVIKSVVDFYILQSIHAALFRMFAPHTTHTHNFFLYSYNRLHRFEIGVLLYGIIPISHSYRWSFDYRVCILYFVQAITTIRIISCRYGDIVEIELMNRVCLHDDELNAFNV